MNKIIQAFKENGEYRGLLSLADEVSSHSGKTPASLSGLCDDARKAFFAAFAGDTAGKREKPLLCILPDEKEISRLETSLDVCGIEYRTYPSRDFIFHNITSSHECEHERLSVLNWILSGGKGALLTTPDALLQYTIPKERLLSGALTIEKGDEGDINQIVSFLVSSGYVRTDMVDGKGRYSVRGGILDIFPPFYEYPLRIEFFDREIERISFFDTLNQRRIEDSDRVEITPAREILIDGDKKAELIKIIELQLKKAKGDYAREQLSIELEDLKNGDELRSADKYISAVYPERVCLMDYFDETDIFVLQEYNSVGERLKGFEYQSKQNLEALAASEEINMKYADYNKWADDLDIFISRAFGVMLSAFSVSMKGMKLSGSFSMAARQTVSLADNFELLKEELENYKRSKFKVLISCENEKSANNLYNLLAENDISAILAEENIPGVPLITHSYGAFAFELPSDRFACLSMYSGLAAYNQSSVKKRERRFKKKKAKERIMSYADIEAGDYVVHDAHGIGRYLGLQTLSVEGFTRDFVKIQYAGSDMLYLPCNQLDSLAKYIGEHSEDGTLKLSKMGGSEWGKTKQRVKAAAKGMARELIQLYAARLRKPGYTFSKDDDMQRSFEGEFPYEETEGQIESINEIKHDMSQRYPMDRLLCGDVGFGKTEVALRAAFKAINDSKQVALLVPTTILALQHYQTICARMRSFPIKVDMLSRFRTKREQAEAIRKLKRGETDIIVGTHRLVSEDVSFKDLGLVIIDEEQRFGVAHKEKLKQISENVDVLTLTATPIPRTMNMAMSGIRDMSLLEEAPQDRQTVQSYVLEYDEVIISGAIKKELRRGGQVFYLHNNIETIDYAASRILQMVPEARIATAHGQMDKEYLSDIWRELLEGKIDVFVCTTIIETGVDIPNANTLIIENADKMGLSQLHQIRGRVGRSSRKAYAYFTFGKGKVLSEVASKRLSAIREYTEFGSGFKVALRDMEIRGAGNLLGSEQHGHMAKVGYDMYMKILEEAILEEKGVKPDKKCECLIDIKSDAYIPEKYIKSAIARIDAYKKIALIQNEEDKRDISDELCDRFGKMPPAVRNLLDISLIRSLGRECSLKSIEHRNGCILFYPEYMRADIWSGIVRECRGRLLLNMSTRPYASLKIKSGENYLEKIIDVLIKYIQLLGEKV